jgi:acyl transferase domain-containing protein
MSNSTKKAESSPLLRAYLAIQELEAKVETLQRTQREPIAVVGMGCRFPGADGPEAFWELLRQGCDATREVPADRWDYGSFFDPAPQTPGKAYVNRGGYLDDVAGFDAEFFGLSPREAASMDPQQRLLLEVSWEALENAGFAPHTLSGSRAGVFFGLMNLDYPQMLLASTQPERIDAFFGAGSEPSFLAGRVSYLLGLHGPSMVLATACSSSLVAIHLACQSLRLGECKLALAGGVNLILNPHANVVLCKMNALSPDGRCKTFDASADGYGRGEGCGVVVLKRLSDALSDNDHILALLRGTAVNHGGPSGGLTVPSGPAQTIVVRDALQAAGIEPASLGYIEAHGTGTSLGDPIELRALGTVLDARPTENKCRIGSVKANIGHLESAAGVAGLIKVILSLQHEEIPPQPAIQQPNPHIPWSELPLEVASQVTPWKRGEKWRLAGLSSFGLSGINAHAVIEEAPLVAMEAAASERPWHLLQLSARSEPALRALAGRWGKHISDHAREKLPDIAFTANTGRTTFAHRLAVVAENAAEAGRSLTAFAEGRQGEGLRIARIAGEKPTRIAFLFPGVRAQYVGMGRSLYETQAVFRRALDKCAGLLAAYLDQPLTSILYPAAGSSSRLEEPLYTQAALFAVNYALAECWRSWGVEPAAVLAYGTGEYVAACVAGILSVEDAILLLMTRAVASQRLPHDGAMATVHASETEVLDLIAGDGGRVSLAGVNGARQVVLSGSAQALKTVLTRLERAGFRTEMWRLSQAFRSSLMDPLLDEIEEAASRVTFRPARIAFVSALTGRVATDAELAQPRYWRRQARETVRFADGLVSLKEMGIRVLVEAGPSPVLRDAGQLSVPEAVWLPTLRPERDDWLQMLESLQALWLEGAAVNWRHFDHGYPRRKLSLPSYPFQRQRCWLDGLGPVGRNVPLSDNGISPLIGRKLRMAHDDEIYESLWSPTSLPLFADHVVGDQVIAAGACLLTAALTASGKTNVLVDDVTFREPLVLAEGRTVQLIISSAREEARAFRLYSMNEGESWTTHATGQLRDGGALAGYVTLPELQAQCNEERPSHVFYESLARAGLRLGDGFRWLTRIWHGADQALGCMRNVTAGDRLGTLPPGLLDSCFQLIAAALPSETPIELYLPLGLDRLHVVATPEGTLWAHAVLRPATGKDVLSADIRLFDESGRSILLVEGLHVKRASAASLRSENGDNWLYEVRWEPAPAHEVENAARRWLVLDRSGIGERLAEQLRQRGHSCRTIAVNDASLEDTLTQERPDEVVFLADGDEEESNTASCQQVLRVLQALARASLSPRLWLITRGTQETASEGARPASSGLWGLARVIRREQPALRCMSIDLDASEKADAVDALLAELLAKDNESEIALRNGQRLVGRLERLTAPLQGPIELYQQSAGILDSLALRPLARRAPAAGEVEIEVRAAGLNFRDVLGALGMYPGDAGPPGGECAGIISAIGEGVEGLHVRQEVVALASGSFRSFVVLRAELVAAKPEQLTFEEAAGIPVVFLTAHQAIRELAGLQAGERVLIHAAAGGVGLAALQIARAIGAEVYATASKGKHEFLRSLGVQYVFDSRSLSFADEVRQATVGAGVHVVLNSLTGAFITESLKLLAPGGRFVEIGKSDIWSQDRVRSVRGDVGYHVYALDQRTFDNPAAVGRALRELLQSFASGVLKPLPRRTFALTEAARAFRLMAQARHTGKIVLTLQSTVPSLNADASYVITGGLGGLGLCMARGLAERGARHLLLLGRRPPSPEAQSVIVELQQSGVSVVIAAADVAEYDELGKVLAEARASMPPLRGIIHAAGVLDDGVLLEQTPERFECVLAPKTRGAWNLHQLTETQSLDFFVLFSSAAALLGSAGQGNYAAGNAFLDALAHHRRAQGLPALSINWGPWAEVGMAARVASDGRYWASQGTGLISPAPGVDLFFRLLASAKAQVAVLPIRWPEFLRRFESVPPLLRGAGGSPALRAGRQPAPRLLARLQEAAPRDRRPLLAEFIASEAKRLLGPQAGQALEPTKPLQDLGLDSLMAVELRNVLGHAVGQSLPAALLFNYPTVAALAGHLLEQVLRLEERETAEAPATGKAESVLDSVEQISDEEVERLLQEMTSGNRGERP